MLFNSLEFAIFFPSVTVLYFAIPQSWRWLHLLVASCIFYMAFVPIYILILAFTIVIDYFAGILLEISRGRVRSILLACSIVANVGVLAVFKYYAFLAENLAALLHVSGMPAHFPVLQILLPIGLSFHTFQAMSYTIEVYRGHQKAERHFGIYALYVMFYPQLVAGPIERPQNLLHQFRERHQFDYLRVTHGLWMMAVGLFKKIVIADQLAPQVNRVFRDAGDCHGLAVLSAVISLPSRSTTISPATPILPWAAQVMGFRLMRNFDTPYFSTSITEFWRRWHISLSTWFRDYLYFPMGGSRVTTPRWCGNIMIVFLISGLWHGANWTYVIWGAIHGAIIICERVGERIREAIFAGSPPRQGKAAHFLAWLRTFVLVCIAWVFFRARSAGEACELLRRTFSGLPGDLHQLFVHGYAEGLEPKLTALRFLALAGVLWLEYVDRRESLWLRLGRWRLVPRYVVYFILIYTTLYTGLYQTEQQFIYFQF